MGNLPYVIAVLSINHSFCVLRVQFMLLFWFCMHNAVWYTVLRAWVTDGYQQVLGGKSLKTVEFCWDPITLSTTVFNIKPLIIIVFSMFLSLLN